MFGFAGIAHVVTARCCVPVREAAVLLQQQRSVRCASTTHALLEGGAERRASLVLMPYAAQNERMTESWTY